MKTLKNDKGFIVSVTAIIVSVILGIMVLYFSNSIAPNVTSSVNNYSSSQARWAAISGMEHAYHKLIFGLKDIAGVYPFYNGNISIDTMTVAGTGGEMKVTSTGTHGNSIRIFSLNATPIITILMGFEDDSEVIEYDPFGLGPSPTRFWGLSCSDESTLPESILPDFLWQDEIDADECFFFGTKIQNNSSLLYLPVETNGGNYDLVLSLSAGVDTVDVPAQSDFLTGDFLEVYVNGSLIERWQGLSAVGPDPLSPTVGDGTDVLDGIVGTDIVGEAGELTPEFQDFHFNLTEILGVLDTMQLEIQTKLNSDSKYIGINGISLMGSGYDTGSYIEI